MFKIFNNVKFVCILLLYLLTNNYYSFMMHKTIASEQNKINQYLIISENTADQILNEQYKKIPKNLIEKYGLLKTNPAIKEYLHTKQLKIIPDYPFIKDNEFYLQKKSENKYIILSDVNNTELDSISVYISVIFKFLQNLLPDKQLLSDEEIIKTVNILRESLQLNRVAIVEKTITKIFSIFIENNILEETALEIINAVGIQNFITNKSFSWYAFPIIFLTQEYKNLAINQRFEESQQTLELQKNKNYLLDFAKKPQTDLNELFYNCYSHSIKIEEKQTLLTNYNTLFKQHFVELQNSKINNQTLSQIFTKPLENVREREKNAFVIRITNNSSNIINQYFEETNSLNLGLNDECIFINYTNHKIQFSEVYKMDKTKTEPNSIKLLMELINTINTNITQNETLYYNGDSIEDIDLVHLLNTNLQTLQNKDQKLQKIELRLFFNKLIHSETKEELFKNTKEYIHKNQLIVPYTVIDENAKLIFK